MVNYWDKYTKMYGQQNVKKRILDVRYFPGQNIEISDLMQWHFLQIYELGSVNSIV